MEESKLKKVLVIEDEEDVITYLVTWFGDHGFEVEIARSGMEATEKIKKFKPDLITLDIVLPEKTGVRFYRETRKDSDTANIPIIIITGIQAEFQSFISHRRTAPPPDGYIAKPFSQEDLQNAVDRVMGKENVRGCA